MLFDVQGMPRGNPTADGNGNEPSPHHENGQCVTLLVKRQKNDAADAEAICEAAQRPTMRFVAVKGEEQQARAMLFHTRDLLVRQRTQTINALRGHLAEFGVVAPQGVAHVGRLALALEDPGSGLPGAVRALGGVLLGQIADLDAKIGGLERSSAPARVRTSRRHGS